MTTVNINGVDYNEIVNNNIIGPITYAMESYEYDLDIQQKFRL